MTLRFKELTIDDFPQMLEWLAKAHVKQWWNDGDDTLEKVARHYGKTDAGVARFILAEAAGDTEKPIGYFQYYFDSDDVIGIDQFIGDEKLINQGIGEKAIRMFIELISRRHNPQSIILDPSPDNKRAIRCYEKVGFCYEETKSDSNGNLTHLMRLNTR